MTGRPELKCEIHPFGTLSPLKYVVICSFYEGKYLLSQHKKREAWETQGGHIEVHETAIEAAQRELYEESGVSDADLYPVCDYYGYDDEGSSNGAAFLAVVHDLGRMPESEMKKAELFDRLPENLTYPNVTPALFKKAEEIYNKIKNC